ncbi:MAG: hypothetical protein JW727_05820 [Candidatus Aenigmarchaeota archaeon]|nr:hypothetical protein [Candidatus Aenigmarchaeota archaeon]
MTKGSVAALLGCRGLDLDRLYEHLDGSNELPVQERPFDFSHSHTQVILDLPGGEARPCYMEPYEKGMRLVLGPVFRNSYEALKVYTLNTSPALANKVYS